MAPVCTSGLAAEGAVGDFEPAAHPQVSLDQEKHHLWALSLVLVIRREARGSNKIVADSVVIHKPCHVAHGALRVSAFLGIATMALQNLQSWATIMTFLSLRYSEPGLHPDLGW